MHNFNDLKKEVIKKYFDGTNNQQFEAITTVNGPLLVLAGAGSGKTTVIINRAVNMICFGDAYNTVLDDSKQETDVLSGYLDGTVEDINEVFETVSHNPVRPYNILVITFTNKAAKEIRDRLSKVLGEEIASAINASTFHSACANILRRDGSKLGYRRNFTIYDSDDSQRVVKASIEALDLSEKQFPPRVVIDEISSAKNKYISAEEFERNAGKDYRKLAIAKIYKHYQRELFNANALDFDDIIFMTVKLFEQFPEVLEKYRRNYKYIMVDEYQDTNYVQYKFVSMLAQEHKNICVVGDDDQSIYSFRGADVGNILNFESQFGNAKVIRLERNYRSTQNILSAANSVIENNINRKSKSLWTDKGDGSKIKVYKGIDGLDEAKHIAKIIEEQVAQGGSYKDNAILYRINTLSNMMEKVLINNNIPYKVYGGMKFYDRKEIKDMIAYLSVINNPYDTLRLSRIINEPKRGIGDLTLEVLFEIVADLNMSPVDVMRNASEYQPLAKKASSLRNVAKMFDYLKDNSERLPLDDFIDLLLDKTGYAEYMTGLGDEGRMRLENIKEFKSNISEYMAKCKENEVPVTLGGFLEEISLYTNIDNLDLNGDYVSLMTIHSSKGLEFENVFAIGFEEGIFPSQKSLDSLEELEEERRLAYVAMTRAKQNLYISNAAQRMLYGSTNRNLPSRFIKEINPTLIEKKDNAPKVPTKENAIKVVQSMSLQQQLAKKKSISPNEIPFDLTAGERVMHSMFGEGTLISVEYMANDALVEVAFDKVGTKKLMAKFAKLKRL